MATSLFRSEPMLRCQLILQSEAAYHCVALLGDLEAVQFIDSNPDVSSFQRKFVSEVKRCEELERILRAIQKEAVENGIDVQPAGEDVGIVDPREFSNLEHDMQQAEKTLTELSQNYKALKKSHKELLELRSVLTYADAFLAETNTPG